MQKRPWHDFIPAPPVIDFAYLKSCWPEVERREPHRQQKRFVFPNGLIVEAGSRRWAEGSVFRSKQRQDKRFGKQLPAEISAGRTGRRMG